MGTEGSFERNAQDRGIDGDTRALAGLISGDSTAVGRQPAPELVADQKIGDDVLERLIGLAVANFSTMAADFTPSRRSRATRSFAASTSLAVGVTTTVWRSPCGEEDDSSGTALALPDPWNIQTTPRPVLRSDQADSSCCTHCRASPHQIDWWPFQRAASAVSRAQELVNRRRPRALVPRPTARASTTDHERRLQPSVAPSQRPPPERPLRRRSWLADRTLRSSWLRRRRSGIAPRAPIPRVRGTRLTKPTTLHSLARTEQPRAPMT